MGHVEIGGVLLGLASLGLGLYALRQRSTAVSLALFFIAAFLSGVLYLHARIVQDLALALLSAGTLVFTFLFAALRLLAAVR